MRKHTITIALALTLAMATSTGADPDRRDPEKPPVPVTGKERLSDKASDNQRVDNCRVPADRQGAKPRPGCKASPSDKPAERAAQS